MNDRIKCGFCARPLAPGSLRYVLMWRLFADYDGIIDLKDGSKLEAAMEAIASSGPADLEEQIYMESRHILCPSCREDILETLSALELYPSESEADGENGQGERNLH